MNREDYIAKAPTFTIYDGFCKTKSVLENHSRIIVSVSGGSDSDDMVDIVEHLKPDDGCKSVYVWFDTGIEMAATKRHLKYLQERYGIEIHTESGHKKVAAAVLSDGYPFMNKVVSEYIDRLQTHDFQWEDKPFDEKTVLFLIMSDTDTTFNFILAMLQSQLINLLCDRADDKYGGRLPVHVRLVLDEFANIGRIPNFDKLIATIRSREISASIILQSQSQLKAIYKDAAEIISDNCDSVLFLSGRGKNAKEISDALGKETIDSFNTSENRGSQTSHGLNYQKLGKALMSEDEIAIMDGGKCILQLRGVRPFFSEKFDITKHPHYKYLADADKKNTFDVDRFLSTLRRKRQQVVAQDESFDLYEIDLSDEDAAAE